MELGTGLQSLAGGTLGNLGGGIAGSLFSQLAATASLGGVSFALLDSREAYGRRIARILFPGQPVADQVFQDFGNSESPVSIHGIIAGDDYTIRAERMRKILLKPGKLTFVSPWAGHLKVRLIAPAEISYSTHSLRFAHFSAQFVRDPDKTGKNKGFFGEISDTINDLLSSADELVDEAQDMIASVLTPLSLPLALVNGISGFVSQAGGYWDAVTKQASEPVKSAVAAPVAALKSGAGSLSGDKNARAESVSTAMLGVPLALAGAMTGQEKPVISPYAPTDRADSITGQEIAGLLIAGAAQTEQNGAALCRENSSGADLQGIVIAAQSLAVSQLASAWAGMDFTSNGEAVFQRDRLIAAIDRNAAVINNALQSGSALPLSGLYLKLQALRSNLIIDATSRIGTLPHVVSVPVSGRVSLFALCYAVAGDHVERVQELFEDAVTRNSLLHPALCGPGEVKLLEDADHD